MPVKTPSPKLLPLTLAAIPVAFLTIAACSATGSPVAHASGTKMCSDEGLDAYKGEMASAALGQRILEESGASKFRWLPKGKIVTMEYDVSRVNVRYDASKTITAVTCG